jgi:hypothetical protein
LGHLGLNAGNCSAQRQLERALQRLNLFFAALRREFAEQFVISAGVRNKSRRQNFADISAQRARRIDWLMFHFHGHHAQRSGPA